MNDDFEEAEIGNIVVVCDLRKILNPLAWIMFRSISIGLILGLAINSRSINRYIRCYM